MPRVVQSLSGSYVVMLANTHTFYFHLNVFQHTAQCIHPLCLEVSTQSYREAQETSHRQLSSTRALPTASGMNQYQYAAFVRHTTGMHPLWDHPTCPPTDNLPTAYNHPQSFYKHNSTRTKANSFVLLLTPLVLSARCSLVLLRSM